MEKQSGMLSKTLVIGIILFFVGTCIVPNVNSILSNGDKTSYNQPDHSDLRMHPDGTQYDIINSLNLWTPEPQTYRTTHNTINYSIKSNDSKYVKKSSMPTCNGNTLYVGGNGSGNYSRIQDAIDDANPGDTVFVFDDSSPYYENINVNKAIDLLGESRNTTVINGRGISSVITVSADHVSIQRFNIVNCQHDLTQAGINILANYCLIKENKISSNQESGIRCFSSCYNTIEKNEFINNRGYHIYLLENSQHNIIEKNILRQSSTWSYLCDGIWLSGSSNNHIENNEIIGLKFCVGISLYKASSYNVVKKNSIHYNPSHGYSNSIQIWIDSDFNTVLNNTIQDNNGAGIVVSLSRWNKIIANNIKSLPLGGLAVFGGGCNNLIVYNNISFTNGGLGLSSPKNIVVSNNLTNNYNYGIYLSASDNLIYYNNFVNNDQNAYDKGVNIWYKFKLFGKSMGNYWDDYTGSDTNGDGIGDTPYNIPGGNNKDKYPLMKPYNGSQSNQNSQSQQSNRQSKPSQNQQQISQQMNQLLHNIFYNLILRHQTTNR